MVCSSAKKLTAIFREQRPGEKGNEKKKQGHDQLCPLYMGGGGRSGPKNEFTLRKRLEIVSSLLTPGGKNKKEPVVATVAKY